MTVRERSEERIELRVAGPEDAAALQSVFEGAADYFERLTGRPEPAPDAALRELQAAVGSEGREVALVMRGDEAIGSLGWWAGSPEPEVALLGMVLIVRRERGRGYARQALAELETRLEAAGITRIQTGVGADDGIARAALEALGFASLDRRTHVDMDGGRLRIAFYEKVL